MSDTVTAQLDAPDRDAATGWGLDPPRWARALLVALAVAPVVVAVIRSFGRDFFPIGDDALFFIRARDGFTAHQPLLGAWTSASQSVGEEMNNPGPLYVMLVAPFAHLLPIGVAAAVGAGSINVAAIVGVSAAARRIGGWAMQRWMLLAAASLAWTMGSELLFDMWQAHALLLPFLLFLVLAVGCAAGDGRCVPFAAGVGSLLVQTHVSYAYILGVLGIVVAVIVWWRARPVDRIAFGRALRSRTAAITAVVVLVLWIPPLWEELTGSGTGNLTRLARNAGGGDLTLGASSATKIVASVFALPVWWTRSGFSNTVPLRSPLVDGSDGPSLTIAGLPALWISVVALGLLLVLLGALSRWAMRTDRTLHAVAGLTALGGVVGAVLSLSRLTIGPVGLSGHHVRWIWALAVFVHAVALWLAVEWLLARRPATDPRIPTGFAAALIVAVSVCNLPYHAQPELPVADSWAMPAMRRVFAEMTVLEGHGPVVYDMDVRVFEPYSAAMMMRLQELGIEFRVEDEMMVRHLGERRRADGTETTRVFQLEGLPALQYDGDGCLVGIASAVDPADEDIARADVDTIAAALAGGELTVGLDALAAVDPDGSLSGSDPVGAARQMVLDGRLAQLIDDGAVGVSDGSALTVDDVRHRLDLIGTWVSTTFGLFATGIC